VTSLVAGLLAVPALAGNRPALLWLFTLLPGRALTWVFDKLLRAARRDPLSQRLAGGAIARASGLSLLVHLLYGLHLFVLLDALQDPWPTNPGAAARPVRGDHGGGDDRRPGRLRAAVGHRGT
jgi:hypothetical protein